MSDFATDIKNEIERKGMEVLLRVLTDFERGACSPSQAQYAVSALFDASSGIVSDELFQMMSEASKEVACDKSNMERQVKILVNPTTQQIVVLTYRFGEAGVGFKLGYITSAAANNWERSTFVEFYHEEDPFKQARLRFDGYSDLLTRKGFREIEQC